MSIFEKFRFPQLTINSNYIAIEGIDGSGKSSVMKELKKIRSTGMNYYSLPNPNGSEYKKIRKLLKSKNATHLDAIELLNRFVVDMIEFNKIISEKYNELIISDRSLLSTLVYQSDIIDTRTLFTLIKNLAFPQIIYHLETPVDVALERIKDRSDCKERECFEDHDKLLVLSKKYDYMIKLINKTQKRKSNPIQIVRIDTTHNQPALIAHIINNHINTLSHNT